MAQQQQPGDFQLLVEDGHGIVVIAVRGELDVHTAPSLREAIDDSMTRGRADVALDFTELQFIDSTGLSVLVSGMKDLRAAGGDLVLRNPPTVARKLLELTGMSDMFRTEGGTEEAGGT